MNKYDQRNWTEWFNLQTPNHQKSYCLKHFLYKGGVDCKECDKEKEEQTNGDDE